MKQRDKKIRPRFPSPQVMSLIFPSFDLLTTEDLKDYRGTSCTRKRTLRKRNGFDPSVFLF